ncbi:LysR family transcriptional regulator [Polyangium fumosum]|uniref:LysR family transcriptional regulator n=1 Tax=Polyangium fumosum TaxID=889272 RepID=A0A4U1IGB9_9BACT|nr:LysR family transcriptional regulator [Polyangium fumosum]TKC92741.1 LysR family transcriptional regulator [Polyangium fumosum]
MDLINNLQSFLRVAETGSFSAVAAQRGVTQPAISRQVGALEEYLGAQLVQRSTQAVTLTEEGRNLLAPAQQLVDAAEGIRNMTGRGQREPVGSVRVAVPVPLGFYFSDRVSSLLTCHGELSIDLVMRDHVGSLVEEGLDLAVVAGTVEDSSLICRRVGWTSSFVVATPEYLAGRPLPREPSDLAGHDCIVHRRRGSDGTWWFTDRRKASTDEGRECAVKVGGRLSADNESAVYRAAVGGHGIANLSHLLVMDDIGSGRLCRLLPDHQCRRQPVYITYTSRRHLAQRTRAVMDFLVELIQEDPHMKL